MKSHAYQNKGVAVFGLGKSGLSTAQHLHDGLANVVVWDDNPAGRDAADKAGLKLQDFESNGMQGAETLVLSPGVPLTHPKPHPVVELARQSNINVVGDVEVFVKEKQAGKVVGITGTNGKSTTSALIYHMLDNANFSAALGGNIGTPVMDLPELGDEGAYILELSSYQLDLTPSLKADIAVILNVTPDHLDRHGDLAAYTAVKSRIFKNQDASCLAVVNIDDVICNGLVSKISASNNQKLVPVSVKTVVDEGVSVIGGVLTDTTDGGAGWTLDISQMTGLLGEHNWQNAAAAVAVTRSLGLDNQQIADGLRTFGGLAHRMEQVGAYENVQFINDSKATNAEAAEKSLASFKNIYWICGGVPKAGGIEMLAPLFPNICKTYLIGRSSDEFAATLEGQLPYVKCNSLKDAVKTAALDASQFEGSATVLLAPAAASFDQFKSFEARGDAFREIVKRMGE